MIQSERNRAKPLFLLAIAGELPFEERSKTPTLNDNSDGLSTVGKAAAWGKLAAIPIFV